MKEFGRVLRLSLKNRFTVAGVFVCSLIVAVLWGANIGTVYPIIEVVFQEDSTHDWINKRITTANAKAVELQKEIDALQSTQADASSGKGQFDKQIGNLENRLAAEEKVAATSRKLQPYVHRYLPDDPFRLLVMVILFLLVAAVFKNIALVGNSLLVARLGQTTTLELRGQVFHKLLETDIGSIGKDKTGKLIRKVTGDVSASVSGVTLLVGKTLREPLKMIVCIIGACFISWRLLLLSLLVAPAAFFMMTVLARSIKRASRRVMEETAEFFHRLNESFNSIAVVKAFTMEHYERKRFHNGCRELYRKSMKSAFYNSLVSPNNELLGFGVIALGLLSGGFLVLHQETHLFGIKIVDRPMSVGALIAFYAFLVGVSDPARKLSSVFSMLQKSFVAAERVYETLDREPTVIDPPAPKPLTECREDIVFDHVDFHYIAGEPVLKGIDLRIRTGESLAIIGPNGCGKSTLVNLLLRFYDPASGTVKIGSTDLRDVRQVDLRNRMGLVSQQTMLFDDTVMNNIRYGSLNATDQEVVEAANKAHAHRFIEDILEHGYATNVGQAGNRLSGGQRQRIALARAILRDPDILILDEATSQIDPESEQAIHEALKGFVSNRTAIMITHRMSTLDLADRILVMDEGQIHDIGTHDELIARCETYRRLRPSSEVRKSA